MAEQPIIQLRDFFTGYTVGITSDHTYIHQGKGFELSGASASIAAGASWTVVITTPPATSYIHLRPTGISSTANTIQMRIAEGTTFSGGSAATPRNRNRNSSRTAATTATTGVTITVEGTILEYMQVGSGTNASNASGGSGDASGHEWVLKPSTVYSFRFENIGSTTATIAYYNMFWYEESAGV